MSMYICIYVCVSSKIHTFLLRKIALSLNYTIYNYTYIIQIYFYKYKQLLNKKKVYNLFSLYYIYALIWLSQTNFNLIVSIFLE